jgi:hypothetical protein
LCALKYSKTRRFPTERNGPAGSPEVRGVNILGALSRDENKVHLFPDGRLFPDDEVGVYPGIGPTPLDRDHLPPDKLPRQKKDLTDKIEHKLCVTGAGIACLYIAFILNELAISGISFDFFKASGCIGGRCFTHKFSETGLPHDYYDVGAMRFPGNNTMKR